MSSHSGAKSKKNKKVFPRSKNKSTNRNDKNDQPKSPQLDQKESFQFATDLSCVSSDNITISKRLRGHSLGLTPSAFVPYRRSPNQHPTRLSATFPPQEELRFGYYERPSTEQFFGIVGNPQTKVTQVDISEVKDFPEASSSLTELTTICTARKTEQRESGGCEQIASTETSPQYDWMADESVPKYPTVVESSKEIMQTEEKIQSVSSEKLRIKIPYPAKAEAKLLKTTPKRENVDPGATKFLPIEESEFKNFPHQKPIANVLPPRQIFNKARAHRRMQPIVTTTNTYAVHQFPIVSSDVRSSFQHSTVGVGDNVLFSNSASSYGSMNFNFSNERQALVPQGTFRGAASNSAIVQRVSTPHGISVPRPIAHQRNTNFGERLVGLHRPSLHQNTNRENVQPFKRPYDVPRLPKKAHQGKSVFSKLDSASNAMLSDSNSHLHSKTDANDEVSKLNNPDQVNSLNAASGLSSDSQHVNQVSIDLTSKPANGTTPEVAVSINHSRVFQSPASVVTDFTQVEKNVTNVSSVGQQSNEILAQGQSQIEQTGLLPLHPSALPNRPFLSHCNANPLYREPMLMNRMPKCFPFSHNYPAGGVGLTPSINVFESLPNNLQFRPTTNTSSATNNPVNNVRDGHMNPGNVWMEPQAPPRNTYQGESFDRVTRWLEQSDEYAQNNNDMDFELE